uniref:Uncharacterized protein n=1 Tax=Romanomermis culicivorax TaxID=13658 RepID=A0A915JZF6_ROMCU
MPVAGDGQIVGRFVLMEEPATAAIVVFAVRLLIIKESRACAKKKSLNNFLDGDYDWCCTKSSKGELRNIYT